MAIAAPGAESAPLLPESQTAAARTTTASPRLAVNVPAMVLVIAGAVLQLVALASATWLDSPQGRLGFRGLAAWAESGFTRAWMTWAAWVIVVASVGCAAAACVRWQRTTLFRYLGASVGVAGAAMTVAAVLVLAYQTDESAFHLARNYAVGPYLAVLGLLATALGAGAGSGRQG